MDVKLSVDGGTLCAIAEQFGTPLYVYDGKRLARQVQRLKEAFREVPLRIQYASKALTNISILRYLRQCGTRVDAVSIEEVQIALRAGFPAGEILYTPSGVAFSEIREAVRLGVSVNLDNLTAIEQFGREFGGEVPCCVRFNPGIRDGGNVNIQVGHKGSKFGVPVQERATVERIVRDHRLEIIGLHVHTGSDVQDPASFSREAELLYDLATSFPDLRFLDFGGGLKVGYRDGEEGVDVEALAGALVPPFRDFCRNYGRDLELWLEPGKFLVSESGYLLVRANVVKRNPEVTFVGVDSGLNHLIRPMMYGAYHEIVNLSNPAGERRQYTVVGYICETDTFGADRLLNEVREGDILAILNAGAYGYSMSSNYNGHPRPAEVLIADDRPTLIRRRESLEDILRTEMV